MTKLETALLMTAAREIRKKNRDISNAFDAPKRAAELMDWNWDGAAANNAVIAFNKLKSHYPSARYNALENAARALAAIASGYEMTEGKNESIADRFK